MQSVAGDFKNHLESRRRTKSVAGNILISYYPFHSGLYSANATILPLIKDNVIMSTHFLYLDDSLCMLCRQASSQHMEMLKY